MKCKNCNGENPEGSKFCGYCGAPLEPEPPVFQAQDMENLNDNWSQPEPKRNKSRTPLYVILGVVIGLAIVGGVAFGFHTVRSGQEKDEKIAQLEEEKERKEEELEKEQEAREEAEQRADDAEERAEDAKEEADDNQRSQRSSQEDDYEYGFRLGWYKANYNMVLRSSGDYNATRTGSLKKGQTIHITHIVRGSNNSYWGESSNGDWVCIQDPDYHYLSED
ncbi:zinc ribbon domain-containing protein [uncultured Faecalicoccus sp.]|uniref:zinc ribbon domain-containing protein n=1 Tax=uncultured Faecalicoccus sp. TaxID=1971760 RepID=UPI00262789A6|nr:zinc ribbon domain-containing protein [uncultured Faecalicoccus sp.]